MRRRAYRATFLLAAFAPLFLYACGALKSGDDRGPLSNDDAGHASDGQSDTPKDSHADADADGSIDGASDAHDASIDAKHDAVLDAAIADAWVGPAIPLVLGSSAFQLEGITSDGWVIYLDSRTLYGVPIGGGTKEVIYAEPADASATPSVDVQGNVVLLHSGGSSEALGVWSKATGLHNAGNVTAYAVSGDGSRIAYKTWAPIVNGESVFNVIESDIDLSNALTWPSRSTGSYWPQIQGSTDGFVVQSNSTLQGSVDAYTTLGSRTHLFDKPEFRVASLTAVGFDVDGFVAASVRGDPPVTIGKPSGETIDQGKVYPAPDGKNVVFATTTSGYWSARTDTAGGPFTFIAQTPATDYLRFAPDGEHFLIYTAGGRIDIASPGVAGTTTVTGQGPFSTMPGFSSDGAYIFYSYQNDLFAVDVIAGVSHPLVQGVDCWKPNCWLSAHDSTVAFLSSGTLRARNAAGPLGSWLLSQSVTSFMVSPAGNVAVYVKKDPTSEARSGLFATPIL